jgi:thiol-disulfide isomerase/thioredoxin
VQSIRLCSVASGGSGEQVWLVRSSARFAYHLDSAAPLLARLDDDGNAAFVGAARIPEHSLLIDLANAGTLAVHGDMIYFAPFIRDEIVAMRSTGDTLWVASRGLPQTTTEPRFELDQGKPVVNYHPVNLGIAVGPDGNLYILSTPGFSTVESRLDVFDRERLLLRSAAFPTALPTIAVSATGRTYLVDGDRLLAGVTERPAERLRTINLPLLSGGAAAIHDSGKVTLVNVWASWCVPCREEMPALDSLQRELRTEARFQFVTVNEDVRVESARRFLNAFGFEFPVLLGRGRAKNELHYPGLPYTILVDAEGRVVRKWIGYAGPSQIPQIRAAITGELRRSPAASVHVHH